MINKFFFFFGFVVLFLFSNIGHSIESEWKGIEEAKVRILSPLSTTNMDEEITIGLQYKLKKGWKTYWKSPGAGGFPQEINYNNSQNIKNIKVMKSDAIILESLLESDIILFSENAVNYVKESL